VFKLICLLSLFFLDTEFHKEDTESHEGLILYYFVFKLIYLLSLFFWTQSLTKETRSLPKF